MGWLTVFFFSASPALHFIGNRISIYALRDGRSMKRNRPYRVAGFAYLGALLSPVFGLMAGVSWVTLRFFC